LLVGALVLVVCLVVQFWLLLGPRALDSAKYFDTAVRFPNVPPDLWTLRIGLIAPVRVAVLVFGPSEAALYAVPLVAGLAIAGTVYATMLVLFGDRVSAAMAALVAVLNPAFLFYSSYIYPDTVATATFTAGFLLLVFAARGEHRATWVPAVAVACAGALFGWTYLTREFSPILLPAVLGAIFLLRYSARRVVLLAGVAAFTAGLELLYGLLRYDDPFIHARHLLGRNDSEPGRAVADRMEHIQGQLGSIFDTMIVFPRLLLSWRSGWLFLLLVAVFFLALALVRDRRLWMLAIWVLSFWAIMSVVGLGTLPSGRWVLNVTNVRYWYPVFPGLVMAAFGGLWLLARARLGGRRASRLAWVLPVALALLIVAPGLAEFRDCASQKAQFNDPAQRWHELRAWFASPEANRYDSVWTDGQTKRLVPAYTATTFGRRLWKGDIEAFPDARGRIPPSTDFSQALLLVQKDRFQVMVRRPQLRLAQLRGEWRPVFSSSDGDMVLLAHGQAGAARAGEQGTWWTLPAAFERVDPGTCGRSPYGG
jgi:hypothetical protein